MATPANKIEPRSAGISYQDLIATDAVPPPKTLTLEGKLESSVTTVPVSRYISKEFHDLEMKKLWPRVWQMACREEQIPKVGDNYIYEIGSFSIIVVRTADGIKAHHNVCRHRGRKLCEHPGPGHAPSFICPFHGFSWNVDGSLRSITSEWDFPHIDKDNFDLTPVKVGQWGGWVFINMDMDAEPFEQFYGDLQEHFEGWRPEERYIEAHVGKIMPVNWKLAQEAFMEAFHVVTTHPQILRGTGDENTQYDAWGNFSRAITPNGTPSPHLRWDPDEQDVFEAVSMRKIDDPDAARVPEGMTARSMMAAAAREGLRQLVPEEHHISDADVLDSVYYTLFPNFHPWGGYNRINYRFRPWKGHHDKSLMECYYLSPFKAGERPAPAEFHLLTEEDDWTDAPELGLLAKVFQQDSFNLPHVQTGLEAAQYEEVTLARYQETKLRHFHTLLNEWVKD